MIEVHFDNIHLEILKEIKNAKQHIKLCVAWFTDKELYSAILERAKKGVKVEIIIANHETNHKYGFDFKELLKNNGEIWHIGNLKSTMNDSLMHNKYCLIDNDLIITGSFNWTKKARKNEENILIIKQEGNLLKKFTENFENIQPNNIFVINKGKVSLISVSDIIAKWDKNKNVITLKEYIKTQAISNKF